MQIYTSSLIILSCIYRFFIVVLRPNLLSSVKRIGIFTILSMLEPYIKSRRFNRLAVWMAASAIVSLAACNHKPSSSATETITVTTDRPVRDSFHADNDIAMTMRSLADAIIVGEPLDSTQYDFEGVLTDGQGTPLYTDVQGAPGLWAIDVIDDKSVLIKNIYLGDLLPLDLQTYILESLGISEERRIILPSQEEEEEDMSDFDVYDCGGAFLCFETIEGIAPNGIEGPQLNIIMSADFPARGGTQTGGLAQTSAMP